MVSPTHVRFPEPVDKELAAYARQVGAKKSTVVVDGLREWLRMQRHPGIVFVREINGERRAALKGGSPQVWTVVEAWLQHEGDDRNPETVGYAVGLTVLQVEVALAYWADYRDEIDELLDRLHAAQDEALAAWERRRALDAI